MTNSIESTNNKNAQIELEHILLELRNGLAQHLRHFVDQFQSKK